MDDDRMYHEKYRYEKPMKDGRTPYGKGEEPRVDPITDWGKGTRFYTCDGKEVESMEAVMQYNQMYYERIMNESKIEENSGRHR